MVDFESKSGFIRRLLGPDSLTLERQTKAVIELGKFTLNSTDSTHDKIFKANEYKAKADIRCKALEKTATRVRDKLDEWKNLVKELNDTDNNNEKKIFDQYVERNKILDKLQQAEVALGEIEEEIQLAPLARTSMSTTSTNGNATPQAPTRMEIKLPSICFPSFDGQTQNWPQFISLFKSTIGNNQQITKVEKMSYLIGQLKGDALNSVRAFSITDENYDTVMTILEKRFGNNDVIIRDLIKILNTLQPTNNSTQHVKGYVLEMDQLRQQLKNLEHEIDYEQFEFLIMEKIPRFLKLRLMDWKRMETDWTYDILIERAIAILQQGEELKQKEIQHRTTTFTMINQTPTQFSCLFCGRFNHKSSQCSSYPTAQERRRKLVEDKKCFKCLQDFTKLHSCHRTCKKCSGEHHYLLCQGYSPSKFPDKRTRHNNWYNNPRNTNFTPIQKTRTFPIVNASEKSEVQTPSTKVSCALNQQEVKGPTLPVLPVQVQNPETTYKMELHAFLDSGSELTYITKKAAKDLQLSILNINKPLIIEGFGSSTVKEYVDEVEAVINGQKLKLMANDTIIGDITYAEKQDDGNYINKSVKPQLLIGSNYLFSLLSTSTMINDKLHCFETELGDIVMEQPTNVTTNPVTVMSTKSIDDYLESQVKDMWQLEGVGISDDKNESWNDVLKQRFNDEIIYNPQTKRYGVNWLWKENKNDISTNFGLAFYRLKSLMKKLDGEPIKKKAYLEVLEDQERQGIISKVTDKTTNNIVSYIPHSGVFRPNKNTTKCRIVFDCSAKVRSGTSLNDAMHQGPTLLPQLVGMLLRFRIGQYVTISDIKQAFLMIELQESERDCVRVLTPKHWDQPLRNDNIQVWRFNRVIFGNTSSPCLLALTFQHHLSKYREGTELLKNTYVDNVMETADDEDALLKQCLRTKQIFSEASMELREYYSNSQKVQKTFNDTSEDVTKILGHNWRLNDDEMEIKLVKINNDGPITKRTVASALGKQYDPQGILSPALLPWKRFVQRLWEHNLEWDTPLSEGLQKEWRSLQIDDNSITIPRFVSLKTTQLTLAVFCDASNYGYGIACYLTGEKLMPNLIFAKAKLFPSSTKKPTLTIPRKELTAIELAGRVAKFVSTEIDQIKDIVIMSDSQVALQQLLKTEDNSIYVRNRLMKIKQYRETMEFRFVTGDQNPADLSSRGTTLSQLKNSDLWWHGPQFLQYPKEHWPKDIVINKLPSSKPTESTTLQIATTKIEQHLVERDLPWQKMVTTVKTIFRFIKKIRPNTPPIPVTYQEAAKRIVRLEQESYPPSEKIIQGRRLEKDAEGVWRMDTRLSNSKREQDAINPIWLPTDSKVTCKIIQFYHEMNHHQNALSTTTDIRNLFYISYRFVKTSVKKCVKCRIYNAKPFDVPIFPTLPSSRTVIGKPFDFCGLDVCGPLTTTDGPGYILLFTCLKCRGVHMELLTSTNTTDVVNGILKFFSRRGVPSYLLSDQAPYFVAARKLILERYKATTEIQWRHTVVNAPWRGSTYERLNRNLKQGIKRTLGRSRPTLKELETLVIMIESTLNNRPILPLYDDVDNFEILRPINPMRPNGCSYEEGIQTFANDDLNDPDFLLKNTKIDDLRKENNQLNQRLDKFWTLWQREYLNSLADRSSNQLQPQRIPLVGEMVLIEEPETPRGNWKLARIRKVIKTKDGTVRDCELFTPARKVIIRAVNVLYPLEIGGTIDEEELEFKTKQEIVEEEKKAKALPPRQRKKRTSNIDYTSMFMIVCLLFTAVQAQQPMICHGKARTLWKTPKIATCNYGTGTKGNVGVPRNVEVFKRNTIEYHFQGYICRLLKSTVSQYTTLSGIPVVKEEPNDPEDMTEEQCKQMITKHKCDYGTLSRKKSFLATTNEIPIDPPNRFQSFLTGADKYIKRNCILIDVKIFSHYGSEKLVQQGPTSQTATTILENAERIKTS
ncbi:unnamed protein product [Bursaphelenchus okinawaensis]|uniref:Integrase catalytic domain-containing protein n=1 Tax=Bursaphelenchus okinawaensis TaxID=465554 RepID=A0A811KBJ1_9BILA|nr:unnamed protein product [Bursaphelenchus okinawaensis]CAG9099361.1 unnamed protein product [Bursaphelenchus okinawaensis]